MNEELAMYSDEIIAALKESKGVRMEISEGCMDTSKDHLAMGVHVVDDDGVKVCGFLIDMFEDAMEVLVYMIHQGDNYNYRMEGKQEDIITGTPVYVHITNVPN